MRTVRAFACEIKEAERFEERLQNTLEISKVRAQITFQTLVGFVLEESRRLSWIYLDQRACRKHNTCCGFILCRPSCNEGSTYSQSSY